MKNVKKIVLDLIGRFGTRDPYVLADSLGYYIQEGPLGQIYGCHLDIDGKKFIYVNSDIPKKTQKIVAAHELGHAVMHQENYYFFTWGDGFYRDKAEIEAHTFAVELLISDQFVIDHEGYTIGQLAALTGYTERLLRFKKL